MSKKIPGGYYGPTDVSNVTGSTLEQGNNGKNLEQGIYTVKVTDATGCTSAKEFIIYNPSSMSQLTDSYIEHPYCEGNGKIGISLKESIAAELDGLVTLALWTKAPDKLIEEVSLSTEVHEFKNLSSGFYEYRYEIGACKFKSGFFRLRSEEIPIHVTSTIEPTCANANTGSIHLVPSGGQSKYNYAYQWDNGSRSNTRNDLAPGYYCVSVTHVCGHSEEYCYTILEKDQFELTPIITPERICQTDNILPSKLGSIYTKEYPNANLVTVKK